MKPFSYPEYVIYRVILMGGWKGMDSKACDSNGMANIRSIWITIEGLSLIPSASILGN